MDEDASHASAEPLGPQPETAENALPLDPVGESPFASELIAPRLGIIHFLAWMAVSGALLKLSTAMYDSQRMSPLPHVGVYRAVGASYALVQATAMVGLGVLLLALARGSRGRFQPGHWLLLIEGVFICGWVLQVAVWLLLIPLDQPERVSSLILGIGLVVNLVSAAVCWRAASRLMEGRRWPRYFRALAIFAALRALLLTPGVLMSPSSQYWVNLAYAPLWTPVEAAALITVVVLDVRCRARRDWLHWLGTGVQAIGCCYFLVYWLLPRLLMTIESAGST